LSGLFHARLVLLAVLCVAVVALAVVAASGWRRRR
jgi:hypothetical protein